MPKKRNLSFFTLAITILMLILGVQNSNASHVAGTDMEYVRLDTGIYQIKLSIVRDCNGIPLSADTLFFRSAGATFFHVLDSHAALFSRKDITGIPPHCPQKSRCNGAFLYGFEEFVFYDTVDLRSYSDCEWEVSWSICCRNGNVTTGMANENHYNFLQLNACITNSSPEFKTTPTFLICHNQPTKISFRAFDKKDIGDSISYHLVSAMQDSGMNCTYVGAFTPQRPLTFFGFPNLNLGLPGGFHLDPVTGLLQFRAVQMNQVATICVEVREWRKINGTMQTVGRTRRDVQLIVMSCVYSEAPIMDSIALEYEICIKDTFCISMTTSDPDSDSTFIYYDGDIPDAVFTSTNGSAKFASGTFCWAPIKAAISETPYVFSVEVFDDNCPLPSKVLHIFSLYVRDSVDGVNVDAGADMTDSLGMDSLFVEGTLMDYSGQPLRWTSSGDGAFRHQDSLSTYYILGAADKKSCSFELYLEAIDSTPCLGMSKLKDTLLVHQTLASFSAGADRFIYPNDTLSLTPLGDTGRAWTYIWRSSGDTWIEDSTNVTSLFAAGDSDLFACSFFMVLQANGCDTLYDSLLVQRDHLPMDAGTDILALQSDTIFLQAIPSSFYQQRGFWRSTGSGIFSDSTNPTATYILTQSDWGLCDLQFIWQELPVSSCDTNADTLHVKAVFTGLDAGPHQFLDIDDTAFLSAGPLLGSGINGFWTSSGTGVFEDVNKASSHYIPSAFDKASCNVKLVWNYPFPSCSQEKDTLVLRFNYSAPLVGPDQQLNYGDTLFLNGNTGQGESFYWSTTGDGIFSDSIDPQGHYLPGPQDWIACGASLIWHSRFPQCGGGSDTLSWTRIPFVLDAGMDILRNEVDSIPLAAALIQNGRIAGWWTTQGDGHFKDSTQANTWYYPGPQEQQNCEGTLYWNAPYSACTPQKDSVHWERQLGLMDAGPNQTLGIGTTVVLQGTSSAKRVRWETNGHGKFLDSSAKSTLYYPDSLDYPMCEITFRLRELEQFCRLQDDSLKVEWKEEGLQIKAVNYDACFMDSISLILEGNATLALQWQSSGSGVFMYDSLRGNWVYLPAESDFALNEILLRMQANGYCFQKTDSVIVPIVERNYSNQWANFLGPIVAYPNPTRDWVTINGDCPLRVVSVSLYDMLGKEIQYWRIQELPLVVSMEGLASGVYLLRIELENGREQLIPITKYE